MLLNLADKQSNKTIKILDIGGSSRYLYEFLSLGKINFEITVLDPLPRPSDLNEKVKYICSKAQDIDHTKMDFDVVLAIDVLEHLPGDKLKSEIIDMALKVAKVGIILAGPFDDEATHNSEIELNSLNKSLFNKDQEWLKEHFSCGKPNLASTIKQLQSTGLEVESFATLPFEFWRTSTYANLLTAVSTKADKFGLNKLNKSFNEQFEQNPYKFISNDGYRKIVVAAKSKVPTSMPTSDEYAAFHDQYNVLPMRLIKEYEKSLNDSDAKLIDAINKKTIVQNDLDYYKNNSKELEAALKSKESELTAMREKLNGLLALKVYRFASKIKKISTPKGPR
jgi:hypothetical protein